MLISNTFLQPVSLIQFYVESVMGFVYLIVLRRILYIMGWPLTHYVAKDDLQHLVLCSSTGITSVHYPT